MKTENKPFRSTLIYSPDDLFNFMKINSGNKKKVLALYMTLNIPGIKSNEKKLKVALRFIIMNEGPYLIHCFAGVDRTGFVSALLEALMGASLNDIGLTQEEILGLKGKLSNL